MHIPYKTKKRMIEGYKIITQEYIPLIENGRIVRGRDLSIIDSHNPSTLKFSIIESYLPGASNKHYKLTALISPKKGKALKIKEISGKRDSNLEAEVLKIIVGDWQGSNVLNKMFRD